MKSFAWRQGYKAWSTYGLCCNHNPYMDGSESFKEWEAGYLYAAHTVF